MFSGRPRTFSHPSVKTTAKTMTAANRPGTKKKTSLLLALTAAAAFGGFAATWAGSQVGGPSGRRNVELSNVISID